MIRKIFVEEHVTTAGSNPKQKPQPQSEIWISEPFPHSVESSGFPGVNAFSIMEKKMY